MTAPAIFVHSIAVLRTLQARGPFPFSGAAGHSLGEYSAHVAADTLEFEDALRLVRRRGELMYEAGTQVAGTMAAILGLDQAPLESALAKVAGVVVPANLNSPGQVVISGETAAVRPRKSRRV